MEIADRQPTTTFPTTFPFFDIIFVVFLSIRSPTSNSMVSRMHQINFCSRGLPSHQNHIKRICNHNLFVQDSACPKLRIIYPTSRFDGSVNTCPTSWMCSKCTGRNFEGWWIILPWFDSQFAFDNAVPCDHTVPSDSIARLVERRTGVPKGASSNPARFNSFSVDVSSVSKSWNFLFMFLWGWFLWRCST